MKSTEIQVWHLKYRGKHPGFLLDPDTYTAMRLFKNGGYEKVAVISQEQSLFHNNDSNVKLIEAYDLTSDSGWQYGPRVDCVLRDITTARSTDIGDVAKLYDNLYLMTFKGWRIIEYM